MNAVRLGAILVPTIIGVVAAANMPTETLETAGVLYPIESSVTERRQGQAIVVATSVMIGGLTAAFLV
jgi:hypothetical protein